MGIYLPSRISAHVHLAVIQVSLRVHLPGNVLLASSPESPHGFCVKISDFGLARKMDIQSRIETKTTGTVSYMPPEVLSEGIVSKVRALCIKCHLI